MKSLITVIVPVYNAEPYLQTCLDSLTAQTYEALELILVDDGSTDGSREICEAYAQKDPRIRVLWQENSGAAAARNAGLAVASGEWIGWMDADDWGDPELYEYLLDLAVYYDAELSQCGVVYEGRSSRQVLCPEASICSITPFQTITEWKYFTNQVYNKLYHRSLLETIRFEDGYLIGDDLLFNLDVLPKVERIAFGGEVKYHYRQQAESLCHREPTRESVESFRNILRDAMEQSGKDHVAYVHFQTEYLRNELDVCSKIVCFRFHGWKALRDEVRSSLCGEFRYVPRNGYFTCLERLKLFLIRRCWRIYEVLILCRHRRLRPKGKG